MHNRPMIGRRRFKTSGFLLLVAVLAAALGAYLVYTNQEIHHEPGVLAPDPPHQRALQAPEAIQYRGYQLTPVAHFELEARVLGKKQYRRDPRARLAPYDVAIGWGPMSDSAILDQLSIIQTGRVYTWQGGDDLISTREVIRHSTNMHLIAANANVRRTLLRLKEGHVVRLRGRLVNVLAADGARWRTSTSRSDAGMGACEIVWVESLEIVDG